MHTSAKFKGRAKKKCQIKWKIDFICVYIMFLDFVLIRARQGDGWQDESSEVHSGLCYKTRLKRGYFSIEFAVTLSKYYPLTESK